MDALKKEAERVAKEYNRLLGEIKESPLSDSIKAQLCFNLMEVYAVKAGLSQEDMKHAEA